MVLRHSRMLGLGVIAAAGPAFGQAPASTPSTGKPAPEARPTKHITVAQATMKNLVKQTLQFGHFTDVVRCQFSGDNLARAGGPRDAVCASAEASGYRVSDPAIRPHRRSSGRYYRRGDAMAPHDHRLW